MKAGPRPKLQGWAVWGKIRKSPILMRESGDFWLFEVGTGLQPFGSRIVTIASRKICGFQDTRFTPVHAPSALPFPCTPSAIPESVLPLVGLLPRIDHASNGPVVSGQALPPSVDPWRDRRAFGSVSCLGSLDSRRECLCASLRHIVPRSQGSLGDSHSLASPAAVHGVHSRFCRASPPPACRFTVPTMA